LAATATAKGDLDTRIAYLQSALAYEPNNPLLHVEIADLYRLRQQKYEDSLDFAWRVGAWSSLTGQLLAGKLAAAQRAGESAPISRQITTDIAAAFFHNFQARSQCACLVQPHLFMAAHLELLRHADRQEVYLTRACTLDPSNSKTWYVAGLKALGEDQPDRSWECWRRSLECNTNQLPEILLRALPLLSSSELIRKVIPQDAGVLYETSVQLESADAADDGPKQCLLAALEVLDHNGTKTNSEWILQARIQVRLQHVDAAVASYCEALARDPSRVDWRLEYCRYLADVGRLREARRALMVLESLHPHYGSHAKKLYELVNRETATKETAP
jgi:Tfp pilus assembly protein PilF